MLSIDQDVMGYCDARGDDHQIKKETLFSIFVCEGNKELVMITRNPFFSLR